MGIRARSTTTGWCGPSSLTRIPGSPIGWTRPATAPGRSSCAACGHESAPVPSTRVVKFDGHRRCAASQHPPRRSRRAQRDDRRPATRGEQEVLPMTLDADEIEAEARQQTGLDDFGDGEYREGLDRLVRSFNEEADLTRDRRGHAAHAPGQPPGRPASGSRTPIARIRTIDDEEIEGPVFVIGLPRTGTTALSQLVAADPQFRSLRMWESSSPCPPPESATRAHRPPHRRRRSRPGDDVRDVPAHGEHASPGGDHGDRVPRPPGHELPDDALRRLRPRPVLPGLGRRTATCAARIATTGGCCSSCSGTARRGSGT